MEKRKYDSTVARIAGNIAPGLIATGEYINSMTGGLKLKQLAYDSVEAARFIVAEVERTEPAKEDPQLVAVEGSR